jgi:Flp pilus assembly protein TadG
LRKIKRIFQQLASTDGTEILEAAVVLPVVLMLLLGIVWFGRAFNIYSTITQAAQQGAITAARSSCVTCGNANPNDASVASAVTAVMQASNLDPTQIINPGLPAPFLCVNPPGACGTNGNITICRNVELNPTAGNTQTPQCGTVVSFQYPFKFYLPFTSLNLQQVVMTAHAESRMEN